MEEQRQEKFMALFRPLQDKLWRFSLAMTRDYHNASDVYSETVLIAYQYFDRLRNENALLSYLFTTASRVYQKQRKFPSRISDCDDSLNEAFDNSASPEQVMDSVLLYDALNKLPEKLREAIVMFEILGFSRKEIADIQATTVANVKIRLFRGRKKLADILKNDIDIYNNNDKKRLVGNEK